MKRTWTKKIKGLPSCQSGKKARENQLQPKVRIFRTSAAIIGLTVSVGTPNLLLTQAAQLPQISSPSTQGDHTAPEVVQVVPLVSALPVATPQVVPSTPYSTAKKATAPTYNPPAPVVEYSAPKTNFTPALQPSKELVPQPPVTNTSLALRLRQHQQASALERTQALAPVVASNAQQNFAPIKARREAQVVQNRAVEIVPNQVVVASSPSEVRSAVSVEANSGWTAKQRLLVERLKNKENPSPLNNPEVVQVPSNIDLAPPVTTLSQPAVVAAPKLERTLPENLKSQALVAATSDQSQEFAGQLQTEVTVLPQTQSNQDLATTPTEVATAPGDRTATEQLAPTPSPVFVQPASVASSANTTPPTEVKAVDEQQIATQALPEAVENSSPIKEIVTSVNEPIIVSATTSEYQVKPGDTLITIASAHRLSLPEVAKFNHLSNPDLLLVDQKIKIPSLTSMTTQANVAVLPPIEELEPTAQTNIPVVALPSVAKVSLVATTQEVVLTNPPAPAYTGVGGNIPGEGEAKPLEPTALNDLQVQYAQKLQNDVQKLKQKYHAQNSNNPTVLVRAVKGESPQIVKPNAKLDDEPINPEFRVAQTYQDLKPVTQKQLINRVNYSTPATVRGRVATAPVSGDNSNESFPPRQVIPELPPLDPAMNYLPQPNGVAPLNGYIWPARGALTSNYGWRWGRMHRGIDIAAPVGTPIFAAASGVVIKSGWNKGGYGNLVDIQHADGSLTRYAHNYRLLVQPGQFVDQGQQISLMGSTGRSTGPHLHFEVRPSGKGAVNPIALLPKSR